MSKSIWHTADEIPEVSRYYLEEYEKSSKEIGYLINKRYGNINTIDDLTTKRWCYLDDLLSFETELKRTRKALNVAVDAMKISNEMVYSAYGSPLKTLKDALEQITALEQKEELCSSSK